jgi:hypothetical protein
MPHPSHARSQDTQPQRRLRAHDENASGSGSYCTGDDYRAALARRDIRQVDGHDAVPGGVIAVLMLAFVAYSV